MFTSWSATVCLLAFLGESVPVCASPSVLREIVYAPKADAKEPAKKEPAKEEKRIKVTVVAILATDKNTKIDPKLEGIAREVMKKDKSLTGYRLGITTCKPITVGTKEMFPAVEGQEVQIETSQCESDPKRICVKVKAPKLGGVTYTSVCSKYFPLVTGYETKGNEKLILAIMVEPE